MIRLALVLQLCACSADASQLPGTSPATTVGPGTRLVLEGARREDLDCDDLGDQASAQRILREDPRDPHGLDADRDGLACEELPPPRDLDPVPR